MKDKKCKIPKSKKIYIKESSNKLKIGFDFTCFLPK